MMYLPCQVGGIIQPECFPHLLQFSILHHETGRNNSGYHVLSKSLHLLHMLPHLPILMIPSRIFGLKHCKTVVWRFALRPRGA